MMKLAFTGSVLEIVRVLCVLVVLLVPTGRLFGQIDCTADLDGNGVVDGVDLCTVLDGWGGATADITGDGTTDARDISKLLHSWGPCLLSTDLVGRVVVAGGRGVDAASVVSSAGGFSVTAPSGGFAFAVDYPAITDSVIVTATAVIDGIDYAGSKSVSPLISGGQTLVGDIVLEPACVLQAQPRFGALPGVNINIVGNSGAGVWESVVFDSGFGPELIFWGQFDQAGAVPAPGGMAAFDGHRWRAFGTGLFNGNSVETPNSEIDGGFAVVGGELYVGGSFNRLNAPSSSGGTPADRVARWDRATNRWVALPDVPVIAGGTNSIVSALCGADFGGQMGQRLLVSVRSTGTGGESVLRLDGSQWTNLGNTGVRDITALVSKGSGDGLVVYALGSFNSVVADWNPARNTWEQVGLPDFNTVLCAVILGADLYVGGNGPVDRNGEGGDVWRWNGTAWTALSGVSAGRVTSLVEASVDGSVRIVAGRSNTVEENVVAWNGTSWEALAGSPDDDGNSGSGVGTLASLSVGGVPILFAGGDIATANGGAVSTRGVARYEAGTWRPVGRGIDPAVRVVIARVEAGQTVHYVGGTFTSADGTSLNGVARWDGLRFTPLGTGRSDTSALCFHDAGDGSGERLYAAGSGSTSIARWTGSVWEEVALPINPFGQITALLSVTTSSGERDLYAGGKFSTIGSTDALGIARWRNGQSWQAVGGGLGNANLLTNVRAIGMHTVAGMTSVYAAGDFGATGAGATVNGIARLDASTDTWQPLGQGLAAPSNRFVATMASANGKLYVGGTFSSIDGTGIEASGVAVWDGAVWSPLTSTLGETGLGTALSGGAVLTLAWMDYGVGPRLIAAGSFDRTRGATSQLLNRIAIWTGSSWIPVDRDFTINGDINTLATTTGMVQSSGVILGGNFTDSAAGDSAIAEWSCE
jgi:hypothetical protein